MRSDEALKFVARCAQPGNVEELVGEYRSLTKSCGFAGCACGAWVGIGRQRTARFFFIDWPKSWLDLYMRRNFMQNDYVVAESRRRMTPFLWSEISAERKLNREEREVQAAVAAYGWSEIFAVPIHGPAGYHGLLTLASFESRPFSAEDRALLHLISLAIHHRCRGSAGPTIPETAPLTPRETECLQWVADGRSDAEIGRRIGISTATAHFHIEGAKRKLGVRSRVEAVALLILRGEI